MNGPDPGSSVRRRGISFVTLGAKDMAAMIRFYREGMGFPSACPEDASPYYFDLPGTQLALYPLEGLARDIAPSRPHAREGFSGITLSLNVESREEVEDRLKRAGNAGGSVLKRAQAASWGGWHGYVADPEGYHWEIVWKPGYRQGRLAR